MPKNSEEALFILENRCRAIFTALAGGGEVSPARRLRAEGMMESLVLLEFCTKEEVQESMAACYGQCFGSELPADWQSLFPFPQIPGFGHRAPVYPSTSD